MSTKALNIEISILKAIGIIGVVMSHHFNQFPYFFSPNSYHIALFYFASGYFYHTKNESQPFRYIWKRIVWFVSVFYVYHLYHALELHLLWQNGIEMGWAPPQWPQLLYYPFLTFSTYGLGFPMWFVMQLFVVQIVYVLIRKILRYLKATEWDYAVLLFAMALLATTLSVAGYAKQEPYILIILRTMFCMFFLHLGHLFHAKLEDKPIFNSRYLIAAFIINVVCIVLSRNITYTVGSMEFRGHIFMPFVVACTGIYICMYAAKAIAWMVDEKHILARIGKNTFHIAAMHMSFGFIVVLVVRYIYGITEPIKDPLYGYDMNRFWALYILVGVLGPVYMIEGIRKVRAGIRKRLSKT